MTKMLSELHIRNGIARNGIADYTNMNKFSEWEPNMLSRNFSETFLMEAMPSYIDLYGKN